jgi:hypothetical protein
MKHARRTVRVGGLTVGLAIGATVAAAQWVASADPLPPFDPFNFAISVDGMTLFHDGTATAASGAGDIAIADGAGSVADAGIASFPGQFDTAFAQGIDSTALSGFGNFDSGFADGNHSFGTAGGVLGTASNGDVASAVGTNGNAEAGAFNAVPSQNDFALVVDPSGSAGSLAEAGNGNADIAMVVGDHSNALAGFVGSFDLGAAFGDGLASNGATDGSFLYAILGLL